MFPVFCFVFFLNDLQEFLEFLDINLLVILAFGNTSHSVMFSVEQKNFDVVKFIILLVLYFILSESYLRSLFLS